jgi:hypothetical protein
MCEQQTAYNSTTLDFWVKEEDINYDTGFEISSLDYKKFTVTHTEFDSYLARHGFIYSDEYITVYYDDYVKGLGDHDLDKHIDGCIKELMKDSVIGHIAPPFPDSPAPAGRPRNVVLEEEINYDHSKLR